MYKMKRKYLLAISLALFLGSWVHAQEAIKVYASSGTPFKIGLSSERKVYGGTIINVTYQGSKFSSPTVKGAFEYACKLVEDAIPTIYPINITVRFTNISGNNSLASVTTNLDDVNLLGFTSGTDKIMVKRYVQTRGDWDTSFNVSDEVAMDFFKSVDASIDFSSTQPFDYNLDPTLVSSNKYDFVTVAAQALLKATGFIFKAACANNQLQALPSANNYTRELLSWGSASENYEMAISGEAYITARRGDNTPWPLASDAPYKPGISLNYFKADPNNHETAIMQYGIAKGSCIRYIGKAIPAYFSYSGWDREIATGAGDADVFNTTASNQAIAFQGFSSTSNEADGLRKGKMQSDNDENLSEYISARKEANEAGNFVLLKDGRWRKYDLLTDLSSNEDYARTIEGYLKLKRVRESWGIDHRYSNWVVDYMLYDYIPQKPVAEMNGYVESTDMLASYRNGAFSSKAISEEDVYVDVEIGIKNLEGTTQVLVEQTDSDYPVPYTYIVDDFSSGRFVAYMNKRYPSSFRITYTNANGSVSGNTFTIDLRAENTQIQTREQQSKATINVQGNTILYKLDDADTAREYEIKDIASGRRMQSGYIQQSGTIDISSFPSGFYVLYIHGNDNNREEFKWKK